MKKAATALATLVAFSHVARAQQWDWNQLRNYPAACATGLAIIQLADTPTCSAAVGPWTDTGTVLHPRDASGAQDVVVGGTTSALADHWLAGQGAAAGESQFNIQQEAAGDFGWWSAAWGVPFIIGDSSQDQVSVGAISPDATEGTLQVSLRNTDGRIATFTRQGGTNIPVMRIEGYEAANEIWLNGSGYANPDFVILSGNEERWRLTANNTGIGRVVVNDPLFGDVDFIARGDTEADLLRVDASGDKVGIGVTTPLELLHVDGVAKLGSAAGAVDGQLKIHSEQGATDYTVTVQPHAAMTQNTTYTLPPDDGDANEVLGTDGGGALSWVTSAAADTGPVPDCGSGTTTYQDGLGNCDDITAATYDNTFLGDWVFAPLDTGNHGDYDLTLGTGNYGALKAGQTGLYASSFSASGLDLDRAFLFRQEGSLGVGNDPGIEFAWMESGNTIRLAIPESGAGNATAFIRSGTFAGPYSAVTGNDTVLCDTWTAYDSNIDCDTSGTGADLFVQDDLEVEGTLFLHETLNFEGATADGNQVILQVGADPGADVTLTFPTTSGTFCHDTGGGCAAAGPTGPTGPTGLTGPTGPTGATGAAPSPKSFAAYVTTTDTLGSGAWEKILFGTERWDDGADFASSTWTPTNEGQYRVSCGLLASSVNQDQEFLIGIYKNGARYCTGSGDSHSVNAGADVGAHVSCLADMNGTTDYLECWAYQDQGSSVTILGGGDDSYFDGEMIGGKGDTGATGPTGPTGPMSGYTGYDYFSTGFMHGASTTCTGASFTQLDHGLAFPGTTKIPYTIADGDIRSFLRVNDPLATGCTFTFQWFSDSSCSTAISDATSGHGAGTTWFTFDLDETALPAGLTNFSACCKMDSGASCGGAIDDVGFLDIWE